jgi:phenylalanyl-tRNA synthetase beta subunit
MVISGNTTDQSWKGKSVTSDFFYTKGLVSSVLQLLGIKPDSIETLQFLNCRTILYIKQMVSWWQAQGK